MIECDDWLPDKGRACGRPAVNRIELRYTDRPGWDQWPPDPILHKCARHTRRYSAGLPGYQIEIQPEEERTP